MCKEKIKKMMPAGKPAGISLHEKFIILYVYTKNTGKSGNTKRKELKKWTKTKRETEEMQKFVSVYGKGNEQNILQKTDAGEKRCRRR